MTDTDAREPSAEYKRDCDECGETCSRVANYCPRCGSGLGGDEA